MGRVEVLKLLLQPKYGVRVDVVDLKGWTPFLYAIHAEQEECALLVFKKSNRSNLEHISSLQFAISDPERMEAVLQALATIPDFFSLLNNSIRLNMHRLRGSLRFLLDFPYLLDIDNRLAAAHLVLKSNIDYEYIEAVSSVNDPGLSIVCNMSRHGTWCFLLRILDNFVALNDAHNSSHSLLQHNILFQSGGPGIGFGIERELFEVISGDIVLSASTASPGSATATSSETSRPLFAGVEGSTANVCVPIVMVPSFNLSAARPAFFEFGQLVGHLLLRKIRAASSSQQQGLSMPVLSLNISECFWKLVCLETVTLHDVASVDSELYKNLQWLLSNEGASDLDLYFTSTISGEVSELVKGGANISVDDSNKEEYVQLLVDHSVVTPMIAPAEQTRAGITSIIPEECLDLFTGGDISLWVTGVVDVDAREWQAYTTYSGYDSSHDIIVWFWEFVGSMDSMHRSKLLRCVWCVDECGTLHFWLCGMLCRVMLIVCCCQVLHWMYPSAHKRILCNISAVSNCCSPVCVGHITSHCSHMCQSSPITLLPR
jgi:hypothetical protein